MLLGYLYIVKSSTFLFETYDDIMSECPEYSEMLGLLEPGEVMLCIRSDTFTLRRIELTENVVVLNVLTKLGLGWVYASHLNVLS